MVVRIPQLLLHADDVPNIIDEDRRGLKVNDDGHHDATKVVIDDLKINVEATVVRRSPMRIIALLLLRWVLLLVRMFQVPTIPVQI